MTSKARRVSFKTLGCKLNQAETESIASAFQSLGWQIRPFGEDVDAIIINGCTVTNSADRKTRSVMNQSLKNPQPLLVITGCYGEAHRSILEADGQSYVIGNDHKSRIPELVDAHFKGELLPAYSESSRDPFGYPAAQKVFRSRAMVKIQDGCDNFCAYCIIPFVRGRAISRPLKDCVKEVETAASSGYREIVLTGVNISRWAEGEKNFTDMVEACLNAKGDFRLRLGSVEPECISDTFFRLFDHPKMTNHLHLCLQSGSDRILKAMMRQYSSAQFIRIASRLREQRAQFNLTSDVIVGFPGENEEDFAQTKHVCKQLAFGHIHTFPYSRRAGTKADGMLQQVSESTKKKRAEEIRRLSECSKRAYRTSIIGTVQEVLVEQCGRDNNGVLQASGLTSNYVPLCFSISANQGEENIIKENIINRIFRIKVDDIEPNAEARLVGHID